MSRIINKDRSDVEFLTESFWGLDKRNKELSQELIEQGKTITELQIRLAKQADIIHELQVKMSALVS